MNRANVVCGFFKTAYSEMVFGERSFDRALHSQAMRAINEGNKPILMALVMEDKDDVTRMTELLTIHADAVYDEVYDEYVRLMTEAADRLMAFADDIDNAPDNIAAVSDREQKIIVELKNGESDLAAKTTSWFELGKFRKKYAFHYRRPYVLDWGCFEKHYYKDVKGDEDAICQHVLSMENGDCDNLAYEYYVGCLRDLARNLKAHVEDVKRTIRNGSVAY